MFKMTHLLKMLVLLSALTISSLGISETTPTPTPPPAQPSLDYIVTSDENYTRLQIINEALGLKIYELMRLPETKQKDGLSQFKTFSNVTSDLFFFCGTQEKNPFACYIQIKKVPSDRLFESPSTTSLKLNLASDSVKWADALPQQSGSNPRSISALILENYLETYCEKSSLNDEAVCHVTIYKE